MTRPKQICLVIEHQTQLLVGKKFNQLGITIIKD